MKNQMLKCCKCCVDKQILNYPEGHFEVLASPNVHVAVVGAQLVEVVLVDAEQSPCHGWSPARVKGSNITMVTV